MKYTDTHEWVKIEGDIATIGVTDHAQHELGDIVYVELPEVGRNVEMHEEAAVLESTKAAADIYAPLSGTIIEVNNHLNESSELVNESPEEKGWIFKLKLNKKDEVEELLDITEYEKLI